jgi:ABC-type lipoprotein export system ATPase subunit
MTTPTLKHENGRDAFGGRDFIQIAEATSPVIYLENVSKHFRQGGALVRAVDEVSLEIFSGDFLVLTGRSGSGKTTLLSLIGGLTTPTAGRVHLFGRDLARLDDATLSALRAERLGFVFQFASLLPTLTALDNVRLPGLFASRPVTTATTLELLGWVGLADKAHCYPSALSGGQLARVALARALANRPALLLADEPTGNLDVDTEREIFSLLHELNRAHGVTILLVTHNPELACYGNRRLRMDSGRLEELVW